MSNIKPINGKLTQVPSENLIDTIIERIQGVIDKAPRWIKWILPTLFKGLIAIVSELEFRKLQSK